MHMEPVLVQEAGDPVLDPGAGLDQVQPVAEELPAAPQLLAGHVAGRQHVCA